jgi:hypothetical protein
LLLFPKKGKKCAEEEAARAEDDMTWFLSAEGRQQDALALED